MAYNLDKKLKEFEFERKQVLHHLALLDANIATLKRAIELTQQESEPFIIRTTLCTVPSISSLKGKFVNTSCK